MDDFPSRQGECQDSSGFLFSHRCGDFATHRCEKCGKEICDRHTVPPAARDAVQGADRVCWTTCGKEDRTGQSQPTGGRHYDPYYDDPYYYADTHYPSYHRGRDDFTDSDEAAVAGGAMAAGDLDAFEDDMGGS